MSYVSGKSALVVLLLATICLCAGYFFWPTPAVDSLPESDSSKDEEFRELVIGTWEDDYQGKRTMVVEPDGKASMTVELSGLNALFASKMIFDQEWLIENGRLNLTATGGIPKAKVKVILNTMGNKTSFKIIDLTESRMHLLDANGKTEYDWRRVNSISPGQSKSRTGSSD